MVAEELIDSDKTFKLQGFDLDNLGIHKWIIPESRINQVRFGSEASSGGVLKKFTVVNTRTNRILYIKAGYTRGGGKTYSVENPLNEKIVSDIGLLLGINIVRTSLVIVDRKIFDRLGGSDSTQDQLDEDDSDTTTTPTANISFQKELSEQGLVLVSVTSSFLDKDETEQNCETLFKSKEISRDQLYEKLIRSKTVDIEKRLAEMCLLDYLCNNGDRHRRNFSFIKSETKQGRYMAPLFDHGLCFLADVEKYEIEERGPISVAGDVFGKPFNNNLRVSFLEHCKPEMVKHLDLTVTKEELFECVDRYAALFPGDLASHIKTILGKRWEYVQKVLLKV